MTASTGQGAAEQIAGKRRSASSRPGLKVTVKPGTYPHGTCAKYSLEGCHCDDCRAAKRVYENHRAKQRAYGRWAGNVDAAPARAHVKKLMATGMGYKRIGLAAGLNPKTVHYLLRGRTERGTPRPKQIRKATADAILAVEPDVVDGQLVDALPVWDMVCDLMALGYSKLWIARAIGQKGPGLQLAEDQVQARNAEAIRRVWLAVFNDKSQPGFWVGYIKPRVGRTHHERVAISRAKKYAVVLRAQLDEKHAARRKPAGFNREGQGSRSLRLEAGV